LGAIVEEHLEYEVPAELERYFFAKSNWNAYCSPSLWHTMREAEAKVPAKMRTDPTSVWNQFAQLVKTEAEIIHGNIGETPPICILPPKTSERITRKGEEGPLMERKLVKHERFHARAENIRRSFGIRNLERIQTVIPAANKQLIKDFGQPAKDAIQLAKKKKWTSKGMDEAEEVLARVEEIIEDCSYEGDAQTCGFARRNIQRQVEDVNSDAESWNRYYADYGVTKRKKEIDPDAFNKLVEMIESRYGSASDYYVNMVARITGRTQTRIPKRQPRLKPSERRAEVIKAPAPAPKPKPQPQPRWEEPIDDDDEIDEIEEAPVEPKKKKAVETEKWIDDDGQEWEVIVKPKKGKKKLAGASWWRKGLRA
jgi:hypothetical protein